MKRECTCDYCGDDFLKETGEINRAAKRGLKIYCSRECSGLGRRKNKSDEQKKEEKQIYDKQYRLDNIALIRIKKSEYFKRTYDPVKAAIQRKKTMPRHIKYCQQPKYKLLKKNYDRTYRAKKQYGEYWECFLLTQDIRAEALSRQSDYEIRLDKGTLSKSQQRKRDYARTHSKKPEAGSLGNFERNQDRQNGCIQGRFNSHTSPRDIESH